MVLQAKAEADSQTMVTEFEQVSGGGQGRGGRGGGPWASVREGGSGGRRSADVG